MKIYLILTVFILHGIQEAQGQIHDHAEWEIKKSGYSSELDTNKDSIFCEVIIDQIVKESLASPDHLIVEITISNNSEKDFQIIGLDSLVSIDIYEVMNIPDTLKFNNYVRRIKEHEARQKENGDLSAFRMGTYPMKRELKLVDDYHNTIKKPESHLGNQAYIQIPHQSQTKTKCLIPKKFGHYQLQLKAIQLTLKDISTKHPIDERPANITLIKSNTFKLWGDHH